MLVTLGLHRQFSGTRPSIGPRCRESGDPRSPPRHHRHRPEVRHPQRMTRTSFPRQLRPAIEMRRNPSTAAPASRFDHDKAFIVDLIVETWNLQAPSAPSTSGGWSPAMVPTSAPSRRCRPRGVAETPAIPGRVKRPSRRLPFGSRRSPGRSVIDCMATATPVIAVGSQGLSDRCSDCDEGCLRTWRRRIGTSSTCRVPFAIDTLAFDDVQSRAPALGLALVDATSGG